ncbi:MAG TPA: heavy-metal-associated domain-containing protein [Anaerolineales bacterium]|jgi:copper chaperone CopZ
MQKSTFNAPALFGDHHVTEVRRMLFALPGVKDVYASSAFQIVQVEFDEGQVNHEALLRVLEEAGYLGQIPMMAESGEADQGGSIFRNTANYATVNKTVSFAQKAPYTGRPLWNCPGMGIIKSMDE